MKSTFIIMMYFASFCLLAYASAAAGTAHYQPPNNSPGRSFVHGHGQHVPHDGSSSDSGALIGVLPGSTSDNRQKFQSDGSFVPVSGNIFPDGFISSQSGGGQRPGQGFSLPLAGNSGRDSNAESSGLRNFISNSGVGISGNIILQGSNLPLYEEHVLPRIGAVPVPQTVTTQVTKIHTLRIPSTSDVWVTSVKMVTVPVTQLSTLRQYVPQPADTVTSFVRITKTPIDVATRTAEIFPTKTMVSVFTRFVTETNTVELWQPIVHHATSYEVQTVPILETQTLLQVLYTTVTATRTVDVTSVRHRNHFFPRPRSGGQPLRHFYHN